MPERLIAIIIIKQVDEEATEWADVPKIKAVVRPELNTICLENTQLINLAIEQARLCEIAEFPQQDENSPEIVLQTPIEITFAHRRGGAKVN